MNATPRASGRPAAAARSQKPCSSVVSDAPARPASAIQPASSGNVVIGHAADDKASARIGQTKVPSSEAGVAQPRAADVAPPNFRGGVGLGAAACYCLTRLAKWPGGAG